VRGLLRRGGFKPSGRNKPASEYLAQAAREGRFPRINNLVDVNNLISLESGLPISLLDLAAVGERAEIRYGAPGEKYVFNSGGQEIELAGLICVLLNDSETVPVTRTRSPTATVPSQPCLQGAWRPRIPVPHHARRPDPDGQGRSLGHPIGLTRNSGGLVRLQV